MSERQKGKSLPETGYEFKYVTIYRATGIHEKAFRSMDYVTRSKKFAIGHADHSVVYHEEPQHVIEALVLSKNVYEAYNPGEYFYDGPEVKGKTIYRVDPTRENPVPLSSEYIKYWTNYAKNRTFTDEKSARKWIFETMEYFDKRNAGIFAPSGAKENKAKAAAMPLYKSGNSIKIGKRLTKPKWSWKDVEIKSSSLQPLIEAGFVSMFDNPRLGPIEFIPIEQLHAVESHSFTAEGQAKVANLLAQVKENGFFRAIIYDNGNAVVDGHHRLQVAKLLKQTLIPAQKLTTDND